jgi:hypothetical protein
MEEIEDLIVAINTMVRKLGPLELMIFADLFFELGAVFDSAGESKRDQLLDRRAIKKKFTLKAPLNGAEFEPLCGCDE